MEINIQDKEWKSFRFDEIFLIKGGFYNKSPPFNDDGDIPYLSGTRFNNGIKGYCRYNDILNHSKTGKGKNHDINDKIFEGNCITVTNNGSVGYAFYQKNKFTCSHDVNILYLKNFTLNKYIAIFLIVAIEQQRICFAYSRKWRPERMTSSNIMLPINENGEPDYKYMETYIKNKFVPKKENIIPILDNKLRKLTYVSVPNLNEKEWDDFFINDIGTITSGIDITQIKMIPGEIPYISSTSQNNGIGAFIGNSNNTLESNCISINRNGSVGYAFYHPYQALYSNDCRKLKINKNKYVSLFVTNQIKAQKEIYNYGYKMGTARLKRLKILLPIDDNGNPDYDYMEQYMINLEIRLLNKYKKHLQNHFYSEYISEKENLMM